jgi:hypothetical protein
VVAVVTERLLSILLGLFRFVFDLLPHLTVPSWAVGIPSSVASLSASVPDLPIDTWINPAALVVSVGFVLLATVTGAAIRIARMGVSHVTGGGGAT